MNWNTIEPWLKIIVGYVLPIVASIISVYSLAQSKRSQKISERLYSLEEKLKQYELDEKELQRIDAEKACVEARLINISRNNYKIKIWNSGKATAYNVNISGKEGADIPVMKQHSPYEFLESGKSYEEIALITMDSPHKFTLVTTWENAEADLFSKEQIVSV